jgi:hypothetical protein
MIPSPLEVLPGVQLAESSPEPPWLSAQFHWMVTSELFQPMALAAGDCDGLAVGARVSPSQVKLASVPGLLAGSLAWTLNVCEPLVRLL